MVETATIAETSSYSSDMTPEKEIVKATWTTVEGHLADGLPARVYLAACDGQLWAASMNDEIHPRSEDEFLWSLRRERQWTRSDEGLHTAKTQMQEYFAGQRKSFDLPLSLRGTVFQIRVWEHLMQIPYGETISYGELAEMIGHPGAFRAVGTANGRNNIGLIIPCHRVLAAGGKLGGYTGGLGLKRRLLAHETAITSRSLAA